MADTEASSAPAKEEARPEVENSRENNDSRGPPDNHFNRDFNRGGRRGGGFRGGRGRGGRGGFNPNFRHPDQNSEGRRPFRRPGNRNEDGSFAEGDGMENRENRFNDRLYDKLGAIAGPSVDLPPIDTAEKKFSGRNRLYIGNLPPDVTEDELSEHLSKCGEVCELFINKEKNFAFAKFDYYANAEKAKREMDGINVRNKMLKIRFAPYNATIKVKNLANFVSNELLYLAFSVFGEVERASVLVDERGKPTGEGIVEYTRKNYAQNALRRCTERCFFLTESLRPCVVESFEITNDSDGFPEKFLPKRNPDYLRARSKGPRLAQTDTFEHEYGLRWKQLLELYAQKEDALKKELQMETEKLEAQMQFARYEHETEMLREQLRAREQDRDRQKQEYEMRERQVEDQRRRQEEQIRRQEESLQAKITQQEEEMRRRQQENNLFLQANELHSMLDEQEESYKVDTFEEEEGGGFNDRFDVRQGYQTQEFGRDRWVTDRRDDFPNKRRRF